MKKYYSEPIDANLLPQLRKKPRWHLPVIYGNIVVSLFIGFMLIVSLLSCWKNI